MIGCANRALSGLKPLRENTAKLDEINVAVARNAIRNGEIGPNEAFAAAVMRPVNCITNCIGVLLALPAMVARAASLTVPTIPGAADDAPVVCPLNGTLPVGALRADVIDVNVARSAKKANR